MNKNNIKTFFNSYLGQIVKDLCLGNIYEAIGACTGSIGFTSIMHEPLANGATNLIAAIPNISSAALVTSATYKAAKKIMPERYNTIYSASLATAAGVVTLISVPDLISQAIEPAVSAASLFILSYSGSLVGGYIGCKLYGSGEKFYISGNNSESYPAKCIRGEILSTAVGSVALINNTVADSVLSFCISGIGYNLVDIKEGIEAINNGQLLKPLIDQQVVFVNSFFNNRNFMKYLFGKSQHNIVNLYHNKNYMNAIKDFSNSFFQVANGMSTSQANDLNAKLKLAEFSIKTELIRELLQDSNYKNNNVICLVSLSKNSLAVYELYYNTDKVALEHISRKLLQKFNSHTTILRSQHRLNKAIRATAIKIGGILSTTECKIVGFPITKDRQVQYIHTLLKIHVESILSITITCEIGNRIVKAGYNTAEVIAGIRDYHITFPQIIKLQNTLIRDMYDFVNISLLNESINNQYAAETVHIASDMTFGYYKAVLGKWADNIVVDRVIRPVIEHQL